MDSSAKSRKKINFCQNINITKIVFLKKHAVIAYHKDELGSMGTKGTYGNAPVVIEANVKAVKKALH